METITDRIIDLHNHSLPGVDDGAKTMEEAIENIKFLKQNGITDIVLTSHYVLNSDYTVPVSGRKEIFLELEKKVAKYGVHLYFGNEVYASDSETILKLLKEGEIITINNSRYLLIEFPLHQKIHQLDKLICDLNDKGIVPIIAHPERYYYFQQNHDRIIDLLEYDCLLQCNLSSIIGHYGKSAKKLMKWLLKNDMVSFIATDFHHINKTDTITKSIKKLSRYLDSEDYDRIIYQNPRCVLEDRKIN